MIYDNEVNALHANVTVWAGTETTKLMKYFKTANPKDDNQKSLLIFWSFIFISEISEQKSVSCMFQVIFEA